MDSILTKEQREFLMYVPIVEEFIIKEQPDRTLRDALTELIAGSNEFSMDAWEKLEELRYIDKDGYLTQVGRAFVDNQLKTEAETAQNRKDKRIDRIVQVASSAVGGVVGEVAKRFMGGNQ